MRGGHGTRSGGYIGGVCWWPGVTLGKYYLKHPDTVYTHTRIHRERHTHERRVSVIVPDCFCRTAFGLRLRMQLSIMTSHKWFYWIARATMATMTTGYADTLTRCGDVCTVEANVALHSRGRWRGGGEGLTSWGLFERLWFVANFSKNNGMTATQLCYKLWDDNRIIRYPADKMIANYIFSECMQFPSDFNLTLSTRMFDR